MKTFTLRLTENGAEALERLAYLYGKSKNGYLVSLINKQYLQLDPDCSLIDNDFIRITNTAELPGVIVNDEIIANDNISDTAFDNMLLKAYRACKYAEEKGYDIANTPELKELYNHIIDLFISRGEYLTTDGTITT